MAFVALAVLLVALCVVAAEPTGVCLAPSGQSEFEKFFLIPNKGAVVRKVRNYFDVYERYFAKFKSQKVVTFVEMGVQSGGSIDLWKHYFGDRLVYHGIDINPNCQRFENKDKNVFIHIGSQDNVTFMSEVVSSIPSVDIVLDDGSHQPLHMFLAFKAIFDLVQPHGVYMVEDTHTNYWKNHEFNGGPHSKTTFMHYAKHLVDELNAFNSQKFDLGQPTTFTSTCTGIGFYDGMVVFEKGPHEKYQIVLAGKVMTPFQGEGKDPVNIDEETYKKYGLNPDW